MVGYAQSACYPQVRRDVATVPLEERRAHSGSRYPEAVIGIEQHQISRSPSTRSAEAEDREWRLGGFWLRRAGHCNPMGPSDVFG
jgi:hypothetical protein